MDVGLDTEKTNSFEPGVDNLGGDEDIELHPMTTRRRGSYDSSRSGSVDPTSHHRTYGETSFITGGDISDTAPFIQREGKRDDAWDRIKRKFANFNPAISSFTASIDDYDRIIVKLNRDRGKYHQLFKGNDEVNDKLPKTIIDSLGSPADKIVETKEEEIARRNKKISELQDQLEKTSDEHMRDNLNQTIAEEQDMIAQLEIANKKIEQRVTLRDRVKTTFKKYGFTVFAVASAVGVIIGVIVANLKNGLTSLGKGVGNGLKTIGKKLGEILPGLVGAIASFVFRTAGEVVGFLAKNAWLLIVGVVIYLVEQFKKKK